MSEHPPAGEPDAWGIVAGHHDGFGHWSPLREDVRRRLVEAMGGDPDGTPPVHPVDARGERVACVPPPRERTWGLSVQLYAARSHASWGIGDLADLATLGHWATARGAQVLLVNPIDAVAPVTPRETSPYSPTTRRFLDPVYLAVRAVPGADRVDLEDLANAGRALNADRRIDRDRAWRLKHAALRRVWEQAAGVREDPAFHAYRDGRRPAIDRYTAYVLGVRRHGTDPAGWPEGLRAPNGPGVEELAATDEAAFEAWLQFCLDRQLAEAARTVPLLRDLPVGFDRHGFDAWTWRDLLATDVTIGAPPDHLGPTGQDWDLPAFVPWKLAEAGYAPLSETLDAAMRHAAGLRVDHVAGLFRLFWIPPGGSASEGAYVRQPTGGLLDVVGRASRRAGAWVVGEDLGAIEDGVRRALRERDILRYHVLWFDDDHPADWSDQSLASVATHDVATVAGLWTGHDLALQRAVGVEPDEGWHWWVRDRLADWAGIPRDSDPGTAAVALHALAATAASRIVVAQVDDLVGALDRPNVPGTNRHQRPDNWSLALPLALDDLPGHPLANQVTGVLAAERPT